MDTFRKIMIRVLLIVLLIIVIFLAVFFESIAGFLFTSTSPNGEFLKVILSVLGGIGVIYGLWINSQRIKAQNKQNKLVEDRNQDQKSYDADKRFGEAIGYLGSDNTSIVLGGIYSLYQLAKEDDRYKGIIVGLFSSFIREKSDELFFKQEKKELKRTDVVAKAPTEIETIINLLFCKDSIFYGEFIDLSNITLKHLKFNGDIKNCSFQCSTINSCNFNGNLLDIDFAYSKIDHTRFGIETSTITNCQFWRAQLEVVEFYGTENSELEFNFAKINNCKFEPNNLNKVSFTMAKIDENTIFTNISSFKGTIFSRDHKGKIQFEYIVLKTIRFSLKYYAPSGGILYKDFLSY